MKASIVYKLFLFVFILILFPSFVYSADRGDSTVVSTSFLYEIHAKGDRGEGAFPWNIEPDSLFPINRAAYMMKVNANNRFSLYFKFSTSPRNYESTFNGYRFGLEQAHVDVDVLGRNKIVLFSGEKLYRDDRLFLRTLSSYSGFVNRWSYGYLIHTNFTSFVKLSYIHSIFREPSEFLSYGGLPFFTGDRDLLDNIDLRISAGHMRFGLSTSSVRSFLFGDYLLFGTDARWICRGALLVAEFSKSLEGRFSSLTVESFKGYDLSKIRIGDFHGYFNKKDAFAAAIYGAGVRIDGIGKINIEPGYMFSGSEYRDPQGEVYPGRTESFVNIWWKHPIYSLVFSMEANNTYIGSRSKDERSLSSGIYMRFKGGLALKSRLFLFDGEEPSIVMSLINDNGHYQLRMTARIDRLGADNMFSFLSHGWMNLTEEMIAGNNLYLTSSGNSLYSLFVKVHHQKRFYLSLVYGSADEPLEEVSLLHAVLPREPNPSRSVWLTARFAFGDL